ncbi:Hypothetical protein R9X50_00118500 [Acrodontium crateriforme]|uniref:DNA-binding protein RAP1 n=1 Tax=Acrodontium crateriforme TaxID=150365 RepID=A0AAQ3R7N8_9PEZI|nr:Hypothetical protein R9X50_00118500 [Acrodontium crateriforme]
MATVIMSANDDSAAIGSLFEGLSFFLVQRVPSRSDFMAKVQANGGRIVKLENQADYIIADHMRKDAPPGSLSFNFIEASLNNGQLVDPSDYLAGPARGTQRAVGSVVPGKSTRTAFTAQEDRELWEFVEKCKAAGEPIKGNEIYKKMAIQNPRHPFQAWRDRYIKRLLGGPEPDGVKINSSARQSAKLSNNDTDSASSHRQRKNSRRKSTPRLEFTGADFDLIMSGAEAIANLDLDQYDDAWEAWAAQNTDHTAADWRFFWESIVRPAYERQRREVENNEGDDSNNADDFERYDEEEEEEGEGEQGDAVEAEVEQQEQEDKEYDLDALKQVQPKRRAVVSSSLKRKRGSLGVDGSKKPRLAAGKESSTEHEHSNSNQGEVVQDGVFQTADGARGDQLTEANLASQQAQHRGQLMRGADLPLDDEQQDQSGFVDYLQSLQPVNGNANESNGVSRPDPTNVQDKQDEFDAFVDEINGDLPDLPMMSQEEIADVIDGNLEWPSSPREAQQQANGEIESEDLPFDPQINHSAAPNASGEQMSDTAKMLSSQPFHSQGFDVSQHGVQPLHPTPHEVDELTSQAGEDTPRAGKQSYDEDELDLTLAEPDGGFASSPTQIRAQQPSQQTNGTDAGGVTSPSSLSSADNTVLHLARDSRRKPNRQTRALETQDILDAETQMPDFDMPSPQDPENESLQSAFFDQADDVQANNPRKHQPKTAKTTQPLEESQALGEDDIESFMDTLKAQYNYDDGAIIDALRSTSMRPQLTELVLLYQKLGQMLPDNVRRRGVWTEREDAILESGDARGLRALDERFGGEETMARMKFLEEWRES